VKNQDQPLLLKGDFPLKCHNLGQYKVVTLEYLKLVKQLIILRRMMPTKQITYGFVSYSLSNKYNSFIKLKDLIKNKK
jgi:hypothetical protein